MELAAVRTSVFTFVDLFAGLGGFHQAAKAAGGECVFASEIDTRLSDIYLKNFGTLPFGDIRLVNAESIPSHDILFAGFPCQPFSKAGKQLGWEDAVRGTLFQNIIKIVKAKRPKVLVMENVAHFVKHDEGQTYEKVQSALKEIGYDVCYRQYSPHQFSVPHIRERIYLIASRSPAKVFVWPEVESTPALDIAQVLDNNPESAVKLSSRVQNCLEVWQNFLNILPKNCKLPSFPIWSMEFGADYPVSRKNLVSFTSSQLGKFRGSFGASLHGLAKAEQLTTVPPYARGINSTFPEWKKSFIRQNREFYLQHQQVLSNWLPKIKQFPPSLQKFEWNCQNEERDLNKLIIQFRASGVRAKRRTTAPSLVAMTSTQIPIIPWEKRYMTIKECARLQSMGDLEHLPSGNLAMTALGNAVNVRVVSHILKSILDSSLHRT